MKQLCPLSVFTPSLLSPSPHIPSQASLDPLLLSSLYASVAGTPCLDSIRLPVGCRGESLGGSLDQNVSMLVKHDNHERRLC